MQVISWYDEELRALGHLSASTADTLRSSVNMVCPVFLHVGDMSDTHARSSPDFYYIIEVFILKLPLLVVYMIIAFNITAFTLLLQLDWLIFHSILAKVVAWMFTIGAWVLAYVKRDKYITLF